MKRYVLYTFWAVMVAMSLSSCKEQEGTEPGHDGAPQVTVYQYAPPAPYNSDEDVTLRFATNTKVKELYYLSELKADKDKYIAEKGANAYVERVMSSGTKISGLDKNPDPEATLTDMQGLYAITVVVVGNGGAKRSVESPFLGLQWADVVSGTYEFAAGLVTDFGFPASVETMLQICTTDDTLYRYKDLFGEGSSMKLVLLPEYEGKDTDGKYVFFRVPNMTTAFSLDKFGAVSVRDIGYWQGNPAFVTDEGFESGMYLEAPNKYSAFVYVQYYCSAGSLGYAYDYFTADSE